MSDILRRSKLHGRLLLSENEDYHEKFIRPPYASHLKQYDIRMIVKYTEIHSPTNLELNATELNLCKG